MHFKLFQIQPHNFAEQHIMPLSIPPETLNFRNIFNVIYEHLLHKMSYWRNVQVGSIIIM